MSTGPRAALPVLLALLLVSVAGVAAQSPGGDSGTDAALENVTMVVQLQPDGDARWSVSTTFDLSTPNETASFRTLAEEFESGEAPTLGLPAFERAARQAATATGRDMEITAVNRTAASNATIENGTGRLTLRFTWTAFANVTDDRLVVGDAFETPGGTWLPGLDRGQHLVIRPPEGYGVFDASKPPENGTVQWHGPTTFDSDSLSATFTGGASDGGPDGPGGDGGDGGTDPGTPDDPVGSVLWMIVATVVVGGTVAAYVLVWRNRDGVLPLPGGETGEPEEPDGPVDPTVTDEGGQTTGAGAAVGDGMDQEGAPEEREEPTELLSDEERVERLLERNGGRMKQASIVKETGWSNAKVSQLLSAMDENNRINKLRIGRENLISLPDGDE